MNRQFVLLSYNMNPIVQSSRATDKPTWCLISFGVIKPRLLTMKKSARRPAIPSLCCLNPLPGVVHLSSNFYSACCLPNNLTTANVVHEQKFDTHGRASQKRLDRASKSLKSSPSRRQTELSISERCHPKICPAREGFKEHAMYFLFKVITRRLFEEKIIVNIHG